jgi:hypothetical protein
MGILLFLLTDDSIREMMKQGRGGAGRGPPKLPKGSLGLGGLVIAGGLALVAINASIFNGIVPLRRIG